MNEDLKEYYEKCYSDVANGGAGGAVQRIFHVALERPFDTSDRFENVLELGATNAEHLRFIRHEFTTYTMLDINDSETARVAAADASSHQHRVEFVVDDAQTLGNVPDCSVDRLISMCLLHHLSEPDDALRRWQAVVKPGGQISIFVPCDPGALWRMGRRLTTFRRARSHGYSHQQIRYLNALDHRNHIASLIAMTQSIFAKDTVKVTWYPTRFLASWNINLFVTIQIKRRPSDLA
ncbi:MAG: class I SAM-dependent methyltransferase [Actinomycetota bacterium]